MSKTDMIIASHNSIRGDYEKLIEMFKKNSYILSEEEKLKFINIYCSIALKRLLEIE